MKFPIIDPEAERLMTAALGSLVKRGRSVWWGTIALSTLTPVQDPSCKTAWTDGRYLGYDPQYISQLPHEQRITICAHEVEHVARKHPLRLRGRDHALFNEACDIVINRGLVNAGFQPWPGMILGEPGDENLAVEQVYARLKAQRDQKQQEQTPGAETETGQRQEYGPSENADAEPEPWEMGEIRVPENDDGSEMTPSDLAQQEREIEVAITQATNIAMKRGVLPGFVKSMIDDIGNNPCDWREALREFATETGKDEFNWTRPNRRFIWQGIYLPGLWSQKVGEGWLFVDTSGSTYSGMAEFAEHIKAICEQHQVPLNILYIDTMVRPNEYGECVHRVEVGEELVLTPRGGGGTDFRPPFAWLEEENIIPKWVVYLTDMCGQMPEDDPGYPVLWAKWGDYTWITEATFGKVVDINDL